MVNFTIMFYNYIVVCSYSIKLTNFFFDKKFRIKKILKSIENLQKY